MDALAALEAQGDALERFYSAKEQAFSYIKREGTQKLVDELKQAIEEHRCVRLGTINTIVLLEHITRLEAALAKEPLVRG